MISWSMSHEDKILPGIRSPNFLINKGASEGRQISISILMSEHIIWTEESQSPRKLMRNMADLFLKQAKQYADSRPNYPPQLFRFIASKTPSHQLAWDVGTGSGQAAQSVRSLFIISSMNASNDFRWKECFKILRIHNSFEVSSNPKF